MDLRITPETMRARVLAQTQQQTALLGKLREQASTGKEVLLPSDDPVRLGGLLAAKAQDGRLEAYLTNLRQGRISLDVSVSALQEAGDILSQARAIAVEGSQSTNSPEAREALAQQLDQLLARLLDVANTQHQGRFLFAGAATATQPFVVSAVDAQGRPSAVAYQGAYERNEVPISGQQGVATFYSGQQIFQSGTDDAFRTLITVRDDLRNVANMPETQQLETLSGRLADLDRVRDNVLDSLGEQAAGLENMQSLENYLMDVQLAARKTVSELEDVDLSQIVVQLQAQENLLRLTLATAAQVMGPSLLDYLS